MIQSSSSVEEITPLQLKELLAQDTPPIPLPDDFTGILGPRWGGIFDPILTPRAGSLEGEIGDEKTPSDRWPKTGKIIGKGYVILDVRDTAELSICAFSRFIHIPLSNLPQELDRLAEDQPMVIVCHHGLRSLHAAIFLKSRGFSQVCNLKGGIHAWAIQVDTTMKTY